jgi:hypothetical protein
VWFCGCGDVDADVGTHHDAALQRGSSEGIGIETRTDCWVRARAPFCWFSCHQSAVSKRGFLFLFSNPSSFVSFRFVLAGREAQ